MKRPTVKDIAREAGVSRGAVSFALNDRPGVSDATRRRVKEVAARLGWTARTDKDSWVLARDAHDLKVNDIYRVFAFDADAWGISPKDLDSTLSVYASKEKK